jgi:hypothetical protein
MRLEPETDNRSHASLSGITVNDHHSQPKAVDINNTSQSLPPGTTYNLDIALGRSDYQFARIMIQGARSLFGAGNEKEGAEILATRNIAEALAHSTRDSGLSFRVYCVTYTKQVGDLYLTHAIFDSNTGISSLYILLQDAYITGSTLRLVFKNIFGGSATLWVKGRALVW